MSTKVTDEEKEILENMFSGDKNRDASSKIRGFLFQDLVTIEYLLEDEVEYVCSEYLEDIDVFYKDGTFKYIQVKYYPCKSPTMEDIMSDLYYQYLRLLLLKSNLTSEPLLVIHRPQKVIALDFDKMKLAVNSVATEGPRVSSELRNWLKNNIYILKKEQQKKVLFSKHAYDLSIKEFLRIFQIIKKSSIDDFQCELEQKLIQTFPETGLYNNVENRKSILLGLAISYVQRRYKVNNPNFDNIRIDKEEFCEEIKKTVQKCSDEHIVAYLKSIAVQVFGEIIRYNDNLSEVKIKILNGIYINTLDWLAEIGGDVKGQVRLVNTLSDNSVSEIQEFSKYETKDRLLKIAECKIAFKQFLKYLWKIIFDICQDKSDFDTDTDENAMNPNTYIVSKETKYVCFRFPKDCVETSVILVAEQEAITRSRKNRCSRMIEGKPKKWFMKGNRAGKYDYNYNTADIRQGDLVTELEDDSFIIECMNCVKVDDNEWSINDNCEQCIFAQTCYNGRG